ncbi:FAD binding domain-containing protein [Saliphagus infecundisoli]|uniref:FAD binding domain-containing protein n=1 Tax=Saliphagus infecundisoli TaxID=1849069 RepID=A0ABD5QGY5_9EURY|nr:FAD binding domain-containing protein [Saliphagus infecundisoli]
MYPPEFDYYRPGDVSEAIDLLSGGGRVLSGGQSLLTELKARQTDPGRLIDVGRLESLSGIDAGSEGVRIGATTTYAECVDSAGVREAIPVFAAAAEHVGDPQVRNRGTVGGNLAQADPEGDLPPAALAADATVHVAGPDGERTIPADDLFEGENRTALESEELVTELVLPAHDAGGYARRIHPASGYAMVSAAVVFDVESEAVAGARVAAGGAVERPIRLAGVEKTIEGTPVADLAGNGFPTEIGNALDRAGDEVDDELPYGDRHASASHRRELLPAYVERAIENAIDGTGSAEGGESR